jgi:hypothetical protein
VVECHGRVDTDIPRPRGRGEGPWSLPYIQLWVSPTSVDVKVNELSNRELTMEWLARRAEDRREFPKAE